MVKKQSKVCIEPRTEERLKAKALEFGIEGRGWLNHFLERIATAEFLLLDSNAKKLLRMMDLK